MTQVPKKNLAAYSKKAIKHLSPQCRKFARLINELESTTRRLKNFMAYLQFLELDSLALKTARLGQGRLKLGLTELGKDEPLFPGDANLSVRIKEGTMK